MDNTKTLKLLYHSHKFSNKIVTLIWSQRQSKVFQYHSITILKTLPPPPHEQQLKIPNARCCVPCTILFIGQHPPPPKERKSQLFKSLPMVTRKVCKITLPDKRTLPWCFIPPSKHAFTGKAILGLAKGGQPRAGDTINNPIDQPSPISPLPAQDHLGPKPKVKHC